MMIGKPIVESYEAEKKMELMCIAIAASALEHADTSTLSALINSNILQQYDIPLKGGKTTPGVVVNPVSTPHLDDNISKLKHESTKHALGSSTHRKYLNTIELFSYVKDTQRFYPKLPE